MDTEMEIVSQCLTSSVYTRYKPGSGLDSAICIPMDKSVMQSADIVVNLMFRKYVSVGCQKWVLTLHRNDSTAFIRAITASSASAY